MFQKTISLKAPILLAFTFLFAIAVNAQDEKDERIINDAKRAKEAFVQTDPLMKSLFDNSYGYVLFPNIGKGAFGIGGAIGNGIVYEKGQMVGAAKMKQLSVGFQLGGQAYRQVIFFENEAALERFKENNFEFAAQASAVAVTHGASANIKYRDGVMVFSQQKGGLMYEASIGGQKFDYASFSEQ